MFAYVCLAFLFLFVILRLSMYAFKRKRVPTEDELEKQLLSTINQRS